MSTDGGRNVADPAQDSSCCPPLHRWLVKQGFVFADQSLEDEFLVRNLNGRANHITGATVALVWAGLVLDDVIRTASAETSASLQNITELQVISNYANANAVVMIVLMCVGALLLLVRSCMSAAGGASFKTQARVTAAGAYLAFVGLFTNVPFSFFINFTYSFIYQDAISAYIANVTHAGPPHVHPNDYWCTHGTLNGSIQSNALLDSNLTIDLRMYGMTYDKTLVKLMVTWVFQKALVIMYLLPAKDLLFVVPINCIALLIMVFEIPYSQGTANHNAALTSTMSCLPFVLKCIVELSFEFLIGVVAASFALMHVVLTQSRLKREIFLWTKRMDVEMSALQREANPFQLDTLRRWLTEAANAAAEAEALSSGISSRGSSHHSLNAPTASSPMSIATGLTVQPSGSQGALRSRSWTRLRQRDDTTKNFWAIPVRVLH